MSDTPKGPSKDEILIAVKRGEGYEDVHPEIILSDMNVHPGFECRVVDHPAGERVGVAAKPDAWRSKDASGKWSYGPTFGAEFGEQADAWPKYDCENLFLRPAPPAQSPIATRSGAGPSEAAVEAAMRAFVRADGDEWPGSYSQDQQVLWRRSFDIALTAAYALDRPADPAPAARRDALVKLVAEWRSDARSHDNLSMRVHQQARRECADELDAILSDSSGVVS